MTHVGRKHGHGADELIADCQAMMTPAAVEKRHAEIAALPTVQWKGRTLYTLRCHGWTGNGPHDVNVPLVLIWSLIALDQFYCMYHAADALHRPEDVSWGLD